MSGLNPFKLKHARGLLEGVEIGDTITIGWKDTYGSDFYFTGEVVELDDWLRLQGSSSYWHYPITVILSVRRVS